MRWRESGVLYAREMRAAVRERSIVVNSILVPLLLYPFILWVIVTGITFVQGQTEGFVSRIAFFGDGSPAAEAIRDRIDATDQLDLREEPRELREAVAAVRTGQLDAVVATDTDLEAPELPGNLRLHITVNASRERSAAASHRLQEVVAAYREEWLTAEATRRGVTPIDWHVFTIRAENVASGRQMGAFLLGLMLPLFFVIMVAVGCFYPAVDATAGERERGTWETLMTVAASRTSIVTSKYLYVATFGCVAGVLNLIAMALSMPVVLGPLLREEPGALEFAVPLAGVPVIALGAILLAAFVAAGMMLFASFARTFKEGQAMITPFYMLVFMPALFLQVPGIEFSFVLAAIPVVNVAMMVREAIGGVFHWPQIAITIVTGAVVIAICIRLATMVLKYEDVVLGSYGGSLFKFLRERALAGRSRGTVGEEGR
jgi:sodium transport system permease protein